jgi:hypothetical protein
MTRFLAASICTLVSSAAFASNRPIIGAMFAFIAILNMVLFALVKPERLG